MKKSFFITIDEKNVGDITTNEVGIQMQISGLEGLSYSELAWVGLKRSAK